MIRDEPVWGSDVGSVAASAVVHRDEDLFGIDTGLNTDHIASFGTSFGPYGNNEADDDSDMHTTIVHDDTELFGVSHRLNASQIASRSQAAGYGEDDFDPRADTAAASPFLLRDGADAGPGSSRRTAARASAADEQRNTWGGDGGSGIGDLGLTYEEGDEDDFIDSHISQLHMQMEHGCPYPGLANAEYYEEEEGPRPRGWACGSGIGKLFGGMLPWKKRQVQRPELRRSRFDEPRSRPEGW